ncbi:ABC transporter related [Methylobacterium sp. 4-46]|uniref:ABC transporter ATP-binding protein n=1 Tax=unclassified Methylobacterium TaxID=2615210 RepID=UPI000152CE40|nr:MULTISPECIES: ABC transporter ATP-binding protein [Methylobacterium]ACA16668.1 ABC transporter related [Methylobacterium sp. 4-46]WFT82370.1 ABC transporter ATP-binding protein [Methylobacterium nodulans]
MTAPVLEIRDLTIPLPRLSDRAHAVEALSLAVAPGEILCVVGESGSGKSVTAHAVMGLLPPILRPSRGAILLQGEDVLRATPTRLRALRGGRMAMVFQEPMTALNPVLTVGAQIDEILEAHAGRLSAAERRARVLALMGDVHLPDPARMAGAYPHQLSGGQRQRAMIAMALANDPALLIADEPTTALDVTTQAQILRLLRELQARRGTGILFITHDFGVVAEIADRVAVMRGGRLVETGPARAVLRRPQDPYTRMLIAAVPSAVPPPPRRRPPATDPVLAVRRLEKTYGGGLLGRAGRHVRALDGVGLALQPGETLGIVGESGSGKSTLARCIARFVDPSGGEIRLDGTDIARLSGRALHPYRRRVQVIFQDPYRSLNPRRTVGQSITEGPRNYGLPREEALARARRLVGLVGLDAGALDRFPHEFSGGQRQRIAIARALAMEPDLLIADEAVSALDVSVQAQVLDLLEAVRERLGLAILFITHDLRVAARLCDRLIVMRDGQVVEEGETAALFAAPRHAYTRALFAAAPGGAALAAGEASRNTPTGRR